MATIQEIFETLCALAPIELQLGFDNSGLLVGHPDKSVSRVLLSLDITPEVIEEAIQTGAELLVAHHPLIWEPLKSVTDRGEGAKVLRMLENGLGAICMHTNLDLAPGGVNDVLLRLLGAEGDAPLDQDGCGRIGRLPKPLPLAAFLGQCRAQLQAKGLRYYDAGRPVEKLAVMGGAGAHAIEDAWRAGCDTYLTSDIKYHQFLQAAELGMNLIDADHFCTENPVMPVLAARLRAAFPELDVRLSQVHRQLISFC